MGFFSKDEKSKIILLRGIKTFFFLIYMLFSFLLFSAPVLLVIADTLIPSAFLSTSLAPTSFSLHSLYSHLVNYDFRYSLIDIPLISIIRSAIILCVYSLCDGPRLSRGPYLTTATICSISSLIFVSLKASYVFDGLSYNNYKQGYVRAMEIALFMCSWLLAIGHIVVAYRTSCRERRKLLVYKIDIEAVSLLVQERISKVSKDYAGGKSQVRSWHDEDRHDTMIFIFSFRQLFPREDAEEDDLQPVTGEETESLVDTSP